MLAIFGLFDVYVHLVIIKFCNYILTLKLIFILYVVHVLYSTAKLYRSDTDFGSNLTLRF